MQIGEILLLYEGRLDAAYSHVVSSFKRSPQEQVDQQIAIIHFTRMARTIILDAEDLCIEKLVQPECSELVKTLADQQLFMRELLERSLVEERLGGIRNYHHPKLSVSTVHTI